MKINAFQGRFKKKTMPKAAQQTDYAMAMDFMVRITQLDSEQDSIESILHFFDMLFSPQKLLYVSLKKEYPAQIHSLHPLKEDESHVIERLANALGSSDWEETPSGFRLKISFNRRALGIIEVVDVKFPEHRDRYLNLAISLVQVCGLAIENARRYEKLRATEGRLRQKNESLQHALSEVKILNGLLPVCMHCKKIRDDQGYWNQIEAYIAQHSEAEFSHSICRDCADEHYPDMNLYDD